MSELQPTIHPGMHAEEVERPEGRFFNGDDPTTNNNDNRLCDFTIDTSTGQWFGEWRKKYYQRVWSRDDEPDAKSIETARLNGQNEVL